MSDAAMLSNDQKDLDEDDSDSEEDSDDELLLTQEEQIAPVTATPAEIATPTETATGTVLLTGNATEIATPTETATGTVLLTGNATEIDTLAAGPALPTEKATEIDTPDEGVLPMESPDSWSDFPSYFPLVKSSDCTTISGPYSDTGSINSQVTGIATLVEAVPPTKTPTETPTPTETLIPGAVPVTASPARAVLSTETVTPETVPPTETATSATNSSLTETATPVAVPGTATPAADTTPKENPEETATLTETPITTATPNATAYLSTTLYIVLLAELPFILDKKERSLKVVCNDENLHSVYESVDTMLLRDLRQRLKCHNISSKGLSRGDLQRKLFECYAHLTPPVKPPPVKPLLHKKSQPKRTCNLRQSSPLEQQQKKAAKKIQRKRCKKAAAFVEDPVVVDSASEDSDACVVATILPSSQEQPHQKAPPPVPPKQHNTNRVPLGAPAESCAQIKGDRTVSNFELMARRGVLLQLGTTYDTNKGEGNPKVQFGMFSYDEMIAEPWKQQKAEDPNYTRTEGGQFSFLVPAGFNSRDFGEKLEAIGKEMKESEEGLKEGKNWRIVQDIYEWHVRLFGTKAFRPNGARTTNQVKKNNTMLGRGYN